HVPGGERRGGTRPRHPRCQPHLQLRRPWQSDDYVHRIGRTGRAGKEGRSLTLVTPDDAKQLKDIERMLGAPVTWIGDPPSPEDLAGGRRGRGRGGRGARPPSSGGYEARGGR